MFDTPPKFIAFCGYPNSGKSTIQNIMSSYGVLPVDDYEVYRKSVKTVYGLSDWQVSTQAGKDSTVSIAGKEFSIRELLGNFSNKIEEMHGTQFKAQSVLNNLENKYGNNGIPLCSFGSVRLDQGVVYKQAGGVVIEVKRDGCFSKYDFDQYNKDIVDYQIFNNGSLEELELKVSEISSILNLKPQEQEFYDGPNQSIYD